MTNNNTQNQTPERDPELERTVKEVNVILWIDDFWKRVDSLWINKALREVLKENKDNVELAKIAISESYSNLAFIDRSLLTHPEIAKEVIKSGIRDGISYFEIDGFVKKYFKLNTELFSSIYKYFDNKIKQASRLHNDDLLKSIQVLNNKNSSLLEVLKEKELVTMWRKSRVSDKFIKFLKKSILDLWEDYIRLSEDDKRLKNLSMLESYLGMELRDLDDDELFFIKTVLKISLQSIDLKKIDDTIESKKKKDKKQEEAQKEEIEDIDEDDEIGFDERLDFCYPWCSYTPLSSWWYELETRTNKKLKITEQENKNLTSVSLRNYIIFYETLYDLGLNFLWDKFKSSFVVLLNNNFWFDYISWEWVTESKLLSTLNTIWKNIWVPEKEIPLSRPFPQREKGVSTEEKKIVTCFDRLDEAKLVFRDIKKTGKINWESFSENWVFSGGAVENYLDIHWLTDKEKWVLNISAWK